MRNQKGVVVLMTTHVLIIVALLISLTFSKMAFFQVKRVHNDIEKRTKYWLAEGGKECAFAQVNGEHLLTEPLNKCGLPQSLLLTVERQDDVYKVYSEYEGVFVGQYFYWSSLIDEERELRWLQGSWYDF